VLGSTSSIASIPRRFGTHSIHSSNSAGTFSHDIKAAMVDLSFSYNYL